jgi:pimeloyl-ACP methyl ester carboxylesterase
MARSKANRRRKTAKPAQQKVANAWSLPTLSPRALPYAAGAALITAAAGAALWNIRKAAEAERRHPPRGRFITVDGVRVHVLDEGQGPAVVLLHGNGTMAEDFVISGLFGRIAAHHRAIAIDRPGYGHSERPRDRLWTASAQAKLVRGVLDEIGVEDAVIVGHSWGTLVALALALEHPEAVRGLVLLSGYYLPTGRADVWVLAGPAVPVVGDVMRYTISPPLGRAMAGQFMRKIFAPLPVASRFERYFPLEMALRPSQIRASAEESAFMVPGATAMQDRYGELRVPTVILTGDADEIVTADRQSIRLADEIPGSELRVLPGLGHMIHYAAAGEIMDAIRHVSAERPAQASASGK